MSNFCPFNITTVSPASVPLIIMLCRTAGIREIVNQMVSWNDTNSRISRLLIETLIICILCERRPCGRCTNSGTSRTWTCSSR